MAYNPTNPPTGGDFQTLAQWIFEELSNISVALNRVNWILLDELHNEPPKPRDGMVVLADGVDWDPGSGAGCYAYYAGSWHWLG